MTTLLSLRMRVRCSMGRAGCPSGATRSSTCHTVTCRHDTSSIDSAANIFAGVVPQDLSVIANVTKVFTSNRWDEASNGSNVQWSTLSPQMQALRTALIARNVYATFATEQGIVVSQAGGNLAIELRVLDYMRDNWASKDWCLALQTHFRSALA